ncbi:MAG: hypothetical protein AWM53_00419 [Candidatus Dichloromethanomonas elyunquensis]|nr:MAG: hypothetical protein AWM53_00419 [Candidatus Dichloromethanomonas elyunquensis]
MHFSVSGVDVFPLIPPLIAVIVSSITASAGISGAFLLLPFQVSVLHFNSPAVSPTNLIYNIIAIPGGLYRYIKEKRMAWALTAIVSIGTLPGVFIGAWIRINYLINPKAFKLFVGIVLLYLGYRLVSDILGWNKKVKKQNDIMNKKFAEQVAHQKELNSSLIAAGLPAEAVVKTKCFSLSKVEYEFWGETYSFKTLSVFLLALGVGLIGGIYGIGGGSIITPVCVSVFALPIYTVAGAALASTFITSLAGVIYYHILAVTSVSNSAIAPDWLLGLLFGLGGIIGTYLGAYLQKFLPETLVKIILLVLISFLTITYIFEFFL